MGTVRSRRDGRCWAGAVLVVLAALGARGARGRETTGYFQEIRRSECQYLNGTQRVKLLERYLYNGRPFLHFDSDVGAYVADSPLGEPDAEYLNGQAELLQKRRAEVDAVCRHNARVWSPYTTRRRVQPEVEIYPVQLGSLPQTDRLVCAVMDFYPPEIEVKWFKNGREETERVVATDVIQNGDWTYQVLVMLETTPQSGDTYTCHVEHVSLQHPLTQDWGRLDSSRSKMLVGTGGLVLGPIALALGLLIYLRSNNSVPHGPVPLAGGSCDFVN